MGKKTKQEGPGRKERKSMVKGEKKVNEKTWESVIRSRESEKKRRGGKRTEKLRGKQRRRGGNEMRERNERRW